MLGGKTASYNKLEAMIFALSTDDKSLMVFASEVEATAYSEGIDVEDGVWLFFDDYDFPLAATFTTPNKCGSFSVTSGTYHLQPGQGQNLSEYLPQIASVEGLAPLNTVAGGMERLASNLSYMDSPENQG
ncbi:hypothetical protein Q9Q94_07775 [Uliginosibacterium sp. 31-16]|uniref:hypothetical protein n=1 Tax=Uliginosibacterium sp. 31-16 TaxID=3068315 RepID=UPI00273CF5AE|nr:hypothetical protein [Uliginosibacterium sp. 31-16]MDP5239425.1 hypothetical protein [Uliginosibacterium sp. 31-16]